VEIRILGAHNIESKTTGTISLLVDGVLAIDAGALTSNLTFAEQQKLKAVLLTHQHYDHIRDVPALGMNFLLYKSTVYIYGTRTTYDVLKSHLVDDVIYPDFFARPKEKPALRFREVKSSRAMTVAGYKVLPVPVNHSVPTIGYQVGSKDGKKVFYTADTGPGLAEVWHKISPDLLVIEVTALNKYHKFALEAGHLTAELLQNELESLREIKSYLPQIVLVHMNPLDERGIKREIAKVAAALNTPILFGREGLRLYL
jgi:ribonuclease BN (tRNA processing enzyme)